MDLQQTASTVQQTLVQKRDSLKKWITLGAMAVAGLIVAPIIFTAITGLIGLGIAAVIGMIIVNLAPVIALKIANMKYRMVDAEKVEHIKKVQSAAAENPIETLTNLLLAKNKAFEEFKINVQTAASARDTFKLKIDNFAKKYPERAPEFQTQYKRMADLVEKKKAALQEAKKSLDDGSAKLDEMKAYWEMSKEAIALNKAAGMDTGDAFEKLKADTACDAVFESMNTAFAQLEVAAALNVDSVGSGIPQLQYSSPDVIGVSLKEKQKARE